MDLVAHLLSKGLRSRNPQLDLWGTDRRVLCVAHRDLMNYLKVHWQLVEEGANETELREKIYDCFCEAPQEFEEFIHLWSGMWIKKWNERVKIILGDEGLREWKRIDELFSKVEPVWRSLQNRHEIEALIVEALIKNGEICGTSILAEDMLKMELGTCLERNSYTRDCESLLAVVNNVLRRARKISQSRGPLIFIRIDKRFFQPLQKDTHPY
jgi:hypothetical protein